MSYVTSTHVYISVAQWLGHWNNFFSLFISFHFKIKTIMGHKLGFLKASCYNSIAISKKKTHQLYNFTVMDLAQTKNIILLYILTLPHDSLDLGLARNH